ncbi:hypothetical protein DEM27_31215 [Metarhizobium album]|uniref:Uncharacterized protein n=1 Tax=Metarhizobium album TaxID=2182425 RepID=A0A2U2DGM4_9HYPH|nr:hypothetical protein [Rhizobium album]PWE52418.1 hypothetical protein DEM27_31215 [Rhizobium album]
MENLRQLSAWPLTNSDLNKVKAVLDSLLAESSIKADTVSSLRIARSILSAYASGVTDSEDLLVYGRVIAKGEVLRADHGDLKAASENRH